MREGTTDNGGELELAAELDAIAASLIARVIQSGVIREGVVMTMGEVPYRRLDCDGRALAYVKTRVRKRAVRVDISGLWIAPKATRPQVRSALGAALLIRNEREVGEVAKFLVDVVETTRAAAKRR